MIEATDPLIQSENAGLYYRRDEPVLREINFDILEGEFVTLLGPSGCGKSTLLRLIAGLIQPTTGTLRLAGQAPEEARRLDQRVGIVFQDPVLLPWRTVAGNIMLPSEIVGGSEPVPVGELMELVGLDPADTNKRPSELSGGMRMRVSLARALVTRPTLFLLDEPFAALDDVLRQQLNEELLSIRQKQGCTTVFVTHNVSEAVFLSQRILIMVRRPATIVADIRIPLQYPREPVLRGSGDFVTLVQDISEQLRGAASCAG